MLLYEERNGNDDDNFCELKTQISLNGQKKHNEIKREFNGKLRKQQHNKFVCGSWTTLS